MTTDSSPMIGTSTCSSAGIEMTKGADGDVQEVLLRVGPGGGRRQRFFGRLLGESREFRKLGVEVTKVYVSRKGKYVVHRQQSEWSDFAALTNWLKGWKNWRAMLEIDDQAWGDFSVEIVDTFEELGGRIPPKIYRSLVDIAENPQHEDLDV